MKRIIVLFIMTLFFLSCSNNSDSSKKTDLTGVWQLAESSSDIINSMVYYHIIFENSKIFSLHNIYNQPVYDCTSKEYSITNNMLNFVHYDVNYSYKFELTRKKDSLTLYSDENWYKFFKIDALNDNLSNISTTFRYNFGKIVNNNINEASGIVVSRKNPGIIWTHNDTGGKNRIFGIDYHGESIVDVWLDNVDLIDCEDIAVTKIDDEDYIILADIGDNKSVRDEVYLYLIPEMKIDQDIPNQSITLTNIEKITLQYPDGQRDAEAIVALAGKKVMIISKREQSVRIYHGYFPTKSSKITLEYKQQIPLNNVVAADLLENEERLIFKNYDNVYSMNFDTSSKLPNVYTLKTLNYEVEPQGEAICWDLDGNGYFTLSEERNGIEAKLYYYPYMPFWMR